MKAIRNTVIKNKIDVVIVFTANKMVLTKLALINWKGKLIGSEREHHTQRENSGLFFPKFCLRNMTVWFSNKSSTRFLW